MNKIQLHLLAFIFAAFLPPKSNPSEEEEDYYTILGLTKSCTQEEIRKAYKKKSLQYHPDKVAQFARNKNKSPEEIRADFVRIKEAYESLSDAKKRNAYDVLGPEGAKMFHAYQDPEGGALVNPNLMIANLARATFVNKSKLFLLVLLAVAIVLIGPILICVKVDSVYHDKEDGWLYNIPWVYVLIPVWIFQGIYLLLALISMALYPTLKAACILVLEVFLALKWDGLLTWNYANVLIPLFLHQATDLIESFVTMRRIKKDVARMVTVSYLEEKILPTFRMDDVDQPEEVPEDEPVTKRYYSDLSEEEKEFINEIYIIVGNNDVGGDDPFGDEEKGSDKDATKKLDPEIKVLFDIANSIDFKLAAYAKKDAQAHVLKLIFTRIPFLVLLVMQLDLDKGWDWNVVFCTIWIEVILGTLSNCFICCFHGSTGMPQSLDDDIIYGDISVNDSGDEEENKVDSNTESEFKVETQEKIHSHDDQKSNQEDERESESDFAPVSFSPLLSTEDRTENVEGTNLKSGENTATGNFGKAEEESEGEKSEEYESTAPEVIQRRSQAAGRCCNNLFLIIFLSMFLVKLNESGNDSGNSGNFSAIWMIFPLLFVAGLIVCCCGCCIYSGLSEENVDDILRKSGVKPKTDKPEEKQNNDSPEIVEDAKMSTGFEDLD